jgi:ATP-binding cassette subfamily F protein 3
MRCVLIRASNLRHAFGDRVTLADVSFEIGSKARIALTGRNGAGKTTLLRVILGQQRPDSGELEVAQQVRMGSLEQDSMYTPGLTVAEVIRGALGFVRDLEAQLRTLEVVLADQPQASLEYADALEAFERAGGYSADARAGRTLAALSLDELLMREAVTLSGGERTRLALACAIVNQPDLLVLDEPTNHLDIRMREWLEACLRDYPGAVLIVSHDRALLDAVAQETWRLERGRLAQFKGGWTKARLQQLEQRRVQSRQHRLGRAEVNRLERAAGQMARWGRQNDKLARRAKAIEKRVERSRESLVEAPLRERKIAMSIEAGKARARLLVRAEHLFKRYGSRSILVDANLRVRAGDRIALIAPNGAGKTTLLRLLLGEIISDPPENTVQNDAEPLIRFSDGVQPAWFDQTHHGLRPDQPVFKQLAARVGETGARALLGRSGFKPEDWPKLPRALSGGERARAGLALIAATRADLLVLDEPTNHLDVEALESLEDALHAYPGSIVFVTHDRAFAKAVASRVLTIHESRLIEFPDGFDGYERFRRGEAHLVDPGRVFEDELAPPELPTPNPAVEIGRLEERLIELDAIFLRGGLSQREHERLKREETASLERVHLLYAERYKAPLEFDFVVRSGPLHVHANAMGGAWHFAARGAESCPALIGKLEQNVFRLGWVGLDQPALPWFFKNMLAGTVRIAFEHLGMQVVVLPDSSDVLLETWPATRLEDGFSSLSSHDYAVWLGLIRQPTQHKPRLVFHPNYTDWARARTYRRRKNRGRR